MTEAIHTQTRAFYGALLHIWAGIETIYSFLFLNPLQRAVVREIVRNGDFDPKHYRQQIPGQYWFYAVFCCRHYAVLGERLGLTPNGYFSPSEYLRLNPDVVDAGVPPYWHWLTKGRAENRRFLETPKPIELPKQFCGPITPKSQPNQNRFACHIHVYYEDLWGEIFEDLSRNRLELDYFVTLPYLGQKTLSLKQRIETDCPTAKVYIVENRGRDILPFLRLLEAEVFHGYEAVCKIHTKRSLHRVDGDRWRRRLISGIHSQDTPELLAKFLADPDLAIWVADNQRLTAEKWWGENKARVESLLQRLGLSVGSEKPYFPSGSMYWIKPFTLGLMKSLKLDESDFESETGSLDGTTAHAVERIVGELALAAGQTIIETAELKRSSRHVSSNKPNFVSGFYLPQFHRIPENDAWWGAAYTEWTALERARPMFDSHFLRRPLDDLGSYNLCDVQTLEKQAKLARENGVDAFCAYFYWFGRKRLLERPIDQLLEHPSIEFPFYLCWANESWRRNWDGLSGEVLVHQDYHDGLERDLADEIAPYFRDRRYQRPDGERLRFVIYRPDELPDPRINIARFRSAVRTLGFGEIEIGGVKFHTQNTLDDDVVDFWIEMPPHGHLDKSDCFHEARIPKGLRHEFEGVIYDYNSLSTRAACSPVPSNTIVGAMPSWDNSPRRRAQGHIAFGATPAGFRKWLRGIQKNRLVNSYRGELMVNAWNEWGETAMLEPCDRFDDLNLQALREITTAR